MALAEVSAPPVDGTADSNAWNLRVKTMAGAIFVVDCSNRGGTLISEVKTNIELHDATWRVKQQCLMIKADADERDEVTDAAAQEQASKRHRLASNNECGGACAPVGLLESAEETIESMRELHNDMPLSEYGLQNHSLVELLVKDMTWRDKDLEVQQQIMHGSAVNYESMHYGSDAQIDVQAAEAIATILAIPNASPNLNELTFRYQRIHNEGFNSISRALHQNSSLTKLTIAADLIWDAAPMAGALIKNIGLTYLNLEHNDIGDKSADLIGQALALNSSLQTLVLDDNSIFDAVQLFTGLRSNTGLGAISISGNFVGDDGVIAFSQALRDNKSLRSACLHDVDFGEHGAHALGDALRDNASLQALDIGHNRFGENGVTFIANGLANNRSLKALNMSWNLIYDEGAVSIGSAICKNTSLEVLFLGDTGICHGSVNLANALMSNRSLNTLVLCCNRIKDDGAESLSEALKVNTTLTILNLGTNEITEVGAEYLANALLCNSDLKCLDLQHNWLDPVQNATLFEKTLETNKTVEVLLWVKENSSYNYQWPTMAMHGLHD